MVWSCTSCNRQKSDHWPAFGSNDTVVGNEGFIDPFEENRLDYFEVRRDGAIMPLKPPAKYIEIRLGLNRSFPKRTRRLRYEAHQHVRKLEKDIAKLEKSNSLTSEETAELSRLQEKKVHIQARLDFNLYDD